MTKSPSHIVQYKKQLVSQMIFDEHLTNKEIIDKLKMPRRTYFWYKRKIQLEQERIWQQISTFDDPQYRFMRIIKSLVEAVTVNKAIMNSEKYKPKDKMESSKIVEQCERYLYQLSKYMDSR